MINNIWILIGKKLNGEASPEELLELEELLKQGQADQYQLSALEELWKKDHRVITSDDLENKWQAFEAKLVAGKNKEIEETQASSAIYTNTRSTIISLIKYMSLSAACILVVLFFYTKKREIVTNNFNEITAPQRGISKIQLPDGSRVWLNSGSKLTYSSDYGSRCRKVSLLGEGLFDVVKDAKHPFIVTTPTISIRVLGTRFNVRSYKNDKISETSLIRGRIELTVLRNPKNKIFLKASEKLTISDDVQQPTISTRSNHQKGILSQNTSIILSRVHQSKLDTLPSEALWIEDKLAFDAENFENLAEKLERRYNVSITFKNEGLKQIKFTGKFQNESIAKVLKALQTSSYFHYKTNNNQILIY